MFWDDLAVGLRFGIGLVFAVGLFGDLSVGLLVGGWLA